MRKSFCFCLVVICLSRPAFAWHHWGCGVSQVSNVVSQTTTFVGRRRLGEPLGKTRVEHAFNDMGGAHLTVDAWKGSYLRRARITSVYEIDTYDCWGNFLGSSTQGPETKYDDVVFEIENPNLAYSVDATYVASARALENEAQKLFSEAKARCERGEGATN